MVSRRAFLKMTGAASLAAAGCGVEPVVERALDPAAPPDDDLGARLDGRGVGDDDIEPVVVEPPEGVPESALFPLGVSAGDLDVDRATITARYDGASQLELVVWLMTSGAASATRAGYAAIHRSVVVTPGEIEAASGFVKVEIDGLKAGARYRYAFFEVAVDGARARSIIGRFRAPIAGLAPLVIGAVSCTKESESFTVLARAAEAELDAFLFLGDTAYCDGAETIDEYREKWQRHIGKPEHVQLRASTSAYTTWDDHEVRNDWNPERIDVEQLETARAALFEHMPIRVLDDAPGRIWRSRRWGETAEIFVLDSRSERKPSTIFGEDEQYLSREQMDWLKQSLSDSPCRFKLIMNSVPITRFPNVWNAWQVDRWDAYDAQRTEILTHIDDNALDGVLWVSGDFHLAKMGMVSPSGPGASQVEILVGPGAQNGNALAVTLIEPYFHWKSDENNYTQIHLDPSTGEARIVYVNADGDVIAERVYSL